MTKFKQQNIEAIRNSAGKACSLLKILANEDRLMLLCQLIEDEKNVGELEQVTRIKQPTLSQQLTILRNEDIVRTRKDGKFNYYSISSDAVLQVMQTLGHLYEYHDK